VQWNPHFLSIQGHPEWVREYSRVRIQDRRNILSDQQVQSALASLENEPDNELFARWIVDFVKI